MGAWEIAERKLWLMQIKNHFATKKIVEMFYLVMLHYLVVLEMMTMILMQPVQEKESFMFVPRTADVRSVLMMGMKATQSLLALYKVKIHVCLARENLFTILLSFYMTSRFICQSINTIPNDTLHLMKNFNFVIIFVELGLTNMILLVV